MAASRSPVLLSRMTVQVANLRGLGTLRRDAERSGQQTGPTRRFEDVYVPPDTTVVDPTVPAPSSGIGTGVIIAAVAVAALLLRHR